MDYRENEHAATPADNQVYHSPREACRLLKCGPTTLYALIRKRRLPARKFGRKTLILRADIDRLLADLPMLETSDVNPG